MEKGFVMPKKVSVASKYGAFFRALCAEGFEDNVTGDSSKAFELTRLAFENELNGSVTSFSFVDLVGGDDE